jgi:hypothetical protein
MKHALVAVARRFRVLIPIVFLVLLLLPSPVHGQQSYVTRFDAFAGYSFLDSPHVGLFENGFAAQAGFRARKWLSIGVDYTWAKGDLTLTPNMLTTELQQSLGAQLAGLAKAGIIPATYSLSVASKSTTQTFAAGPQLAYRHFQKVTVFFRPVYLGVIHENAVPNATPSDPIATSIVHGLAPSGNKTDNVMFIGFGGGIDLILSRHVSWRIQSDLVYDHLFNDLLKDGRFTTRFSIGPAFNFGRNIAD